MLLISRTLCTLLIAALLAASPLCVVAQQTATRDFSKDAARQSPAWVRDAIIYEIFPRAFSAEGSFNGITEKLEQLKDLGVTILWLMPVHPISKEKRKGMFGSPYAARARHCVRVDQYLKVRSYIRTNTKAV